MNGSKTISVEFDPFRCFIKFLKWWKLFFLFLLGTVTFCLSFDYFFLYLGTVFYSGTVKNIAKTVKLLHHEKPNFFNLAGYS